VKQDIIARTRLDDALEYLIIVFLIALERIAEAMVVEKVAEYVQQDKPVKQMEPALKFLAPVLMTAMLVQMILALMIYVHTTQ
jgi:hypothetical protein